MLEELDGTDMTQDDDIATSRFLAWVLRHEPQAIGLELSHDGWASVPALIACAERKGRSLAPDGIERVVRENDKQRFALTPDGAWIRANQGHSIDVELGLPATAPPVTLFHGTATRFLASIRASGLLPGGRRHVHLSTDAATAVTIGGRHGRPVVLEVDAAAMHAAGTIFHRSANGVWLTVHVPPEFLRWPDEGERSAGGSS